MSERIERFYELIKNHKNDFELLKAYQLEIKDYIIARDPFDAEFNIFAGIDVAYDEKYGYAGCVIYDLDQEKVIKTHSIISEITFPYVSTFFSFREGPIILKLFETIDFNKIDLIFLNGHGLMHPRIGLASHIGYLLDISTIGIASNSLIGSHADKTLNKGDNLEIFENGKVIGLVYQSQSNVNPIYISIGHKISLYKALEMTSKLIKNDKFPIPLMEAHKLANQVKSKSN